MSHDDAWSDTPVTCPQRHLMLAAVDTSENSGRAVAYLARWAACSPEARVVLAHVVKEPSEDLVPDRKDRDRQMEENREAAGELLAKARECLKSAGVPAESIETKTLVCTPPDTVAGTLLAEKERDGYDTLVLGRRGMSKREEYIFGSVTTRLVRDAADICVWVVG
ncbi:MAG TPA: universal stress protein [Methylomirabilota bacterium]|nr:universal stress protein [Methylomirabilota bacterium]